MTVADVRDMSGEEFLGWWAYYQLKAQRRQLGDTSKFRP